MVAWVSFIMSCGDVKKVFVPTDDTLYETVQTFNCTNSAISKIRQFIEKDKKSLSEFGLRIAVVRDGCSGNSYDIQLFSIHDSKSKGDKLFKFDDVTVIVEKLSYMFVLGSTLDYVETLLMSGFQISNPNVKKQCSCGSSFSIK